MKKEFEAIKTYIDTHRDDMLKLWETIVNMDSPSADAELVKAVALVLEKEMKEIGMETKIIPQDPAGPLLIGEWNPGTDAAPILFLGHMDTVFPAGTAAKDPFRIDEEGHSHGPGSLDMKAGLVIAIYTIKALKELGYSKHPIKCIFAGDEENAHKLSNANEHMMREAEGAAAAFNFETGYEDDGLIVARKGASVVNIDVHGVASHSGNAPEKGRSAILEMSKKIIEIESKNDLARGKLLNVGKIDGGVGSNTIPAECSVAIHIRFPSAAIKEEILEDLRQICAVTHIEGTTTDLRFWPFMECMEPTEGVMELFEHVKKVAKDCGYGDVYPKQVGGASDSGVTVTIGIPTVCAMGIRGNNNHTPIEYGVVESMFERAYLAACTVFEY